jgi:phenylacetate-CoA ligase
MKNYFEAMDYERMIEEFPLGQKFLEKFRTISRDELRAQQERQFQKLLKRAWAIPFYKRHWSEAGVEPGDVKSLDDIAKLPAYGKSDIMESIERNPPFGDFHGLESYDQKSRPPVIFHTTSGTTGRPQVLMFGPWSREVQNLLLARNYMFQGLQPGDVVHSVYGHGMINGGHYVRETFLHWTQAIFMSAGTGVETRSAQQVDLMKDFGATVIVGFADYIKKLAETAREKGYVIGKDIKIRQIMGHLGREDRESMAKAWGGAKLYDWYGVGDTGIIAGEGPDTDGMYIHEDAHYLEICDIETGKPVEDGKPGDMVVTVLFKDDIYPIIRFNTHDVSAIKTAPSSLGLNLRRLEGFLGRSDNMVKLRGINIFPMGVGRMIQDAGRAEFTGEFICKVERDANGRDDMTVVCEVSTPEAGRLGLYDTYKQILKSKIGIEVDVAFVGPGELSSLTQVEIRQKPIRLIDNRFKEAK